MKKIRNRGGTAKGVLIESRSDKAELQDVTLFFSRCVHRVRLRRVAVLSLHAFTSHFQMFVAVPPLLPNQRRRE